jgi:hypothetical protein
MPRNRKLLEWLRLMQDPDGKAFVQALSEGTKRMTREMVTLNLPAPSFVLFENETILRLESQAEVRKAAFLASIQVPQTAFINIFPLAMTKGGGRATSDEIHLRLGEFSQSLRGVPSEFGRQSTLAKLLSNKINNLESSRLAEKSAHSEWL